MNKSNFTILIAEDQLDIAKFLKQGLTEEGLKSGANDLMAIKQPILLLLLQELQKKTHGLA
ncbi:hypothetical protein [Psychroflexus sp. ALD_RP9]|uniref:hypothetical protein n=1 Tax=Psychroflexus sp. ALD_RP9 TaxID=2777186 RepID=UPI001F5CCB95|nr:hypothetical protein [Psychroflexus sp. ALD_RP9]